jgi:Tfp pilus assembly protein PilX
MSMPKTNRLQNEERGFASIVVALILVIILALVTTGFAQLARREQQSALDKQLANQAYYAAESGVNDVIRGIKAGLQSPVPGGVTPITVATPGIGSNKCVNPVSLGLNAVIDAVNDVQYTCVIVNMTPPTLSYDVKAGSQRSSTFTPVPAPSGPTTISLTIQWGSGDATPANQHTNFRASAATPSFPPSSTWNAPNGSPPLLQFSVTPFDSNNFSRASLTSNTFTAYLYPTSSSLGFNPCPAGVNAGTTTCTAYNLAQQAPIVKARCQNSATPPCSVTVFSIPYNPVGANTYLINFLDFYDDAAVNVNNLTIGGSTVNFGNAQDYIDVTGKARNVLKRIRVSVTPSTPIPTPNAAIQAKDICKHFQTAPQGTDFLDASGTNQNGTNDACNLDN